MTHIHGKRLGNRGAALWWLGWHPVVALVVGAAAGLAASNAIAVPLGLLFDANVLLTMITGTAVGTCVGLFAWYRGAAKVNRDYGDVVASIRSGVDLSEESGSMRFILLGEGTGSTPLVEPDRYYDATVMTLDSDAVSVYYGQFDLVDRRPTFDDDAMVLPYARIRDVTYGGTDLVVETTEADRFSYRTPSEPGELLAALRSRLAD